MIGSSVVIIKISVISVPLRQKRKSDVRPGAEDVGPYSISWSEESDVGICIFVDL